MPELVPVFLKSSEPESGTSVTFADGPGARLFLLVFAGVWGKDPFVFALDVPLGVVLWSEPVPEEFKGVSPACWVAVFGDTRWEGVFEFSHGTGVTEPHLLAGSIDQIDGLSLSGDETMCSFWEAPTTVETVPGDTLVDGLEP